MTGTPRPGFRPNRGSVILEGAHHLYQVVASILLTLCTGVVAMWAS